MGERVSVKLIFRFSDSAYLNGLHFPSLEGVLKLLKQVFLNLF
jgi:hypothetical protein